MTESADEISDWGKSSSVLVSVDAGRPISLTDLFSLVEALHNRYTTVRSSRTGIEPPMAGGPDLALVLTIAAGFAAGEFVKGFFGELGKDSYKEVRRILLYLMKKGRRSDTGRVYVPLAVRMDPWTFHFYGDAVGELSEDEFLERLRKAHEYVQAPPDPFPDGSWGQGEEGVEWDDASQTWVRYASPRYWQLFGPTSSRPSK